MPNPPVIHQAGSPIGAIQKCVRCMVVLQDYTNVQGVGDWRPVWWAGNVIVGESIMAATDQPATCTAVDNNKFVKEFLAKFFDFTERKTDLCPHCGKQVEQLDQVGRCVYCRPCGCRLSQGVIPKAWKTKKAYGQHG